MDGAGAGQRMRGQAAVALADQHAPAAGAVGRAETVFVGEVVADEDRHAAGERRARHHPLQRTALVAAFGHELHDMVARLQAVAGQRADPLAREAGHRLGRMRCGAPVQGQAHALVLDQHARVRGGQVRRLAMQLVQEGGGVVGQVRRGLRVAAELVPVQSGRGQPQRREQRVQLRQRPPADQRHGTAQAVADRADGLQDLRQHAHGCGIVAELDQGAVHVEEQRAGVIEWGRRRAWGIRVGHAAIVHYPAVMPGSCHAHAIAARSTNTPRTWRRRAWHERRRACLPGHHVRMLPPRRTAHCARNACTVLVLAHGGPALAVVAVRRVAPTSPAPRPPAGRDGAPEPGPPTGPCLRLRNVALSLMPPPPQDFPP